MSNLNDFGAMNALLAVINDGDEKSSDVVIAKYLLTHFNRLEELSIYDIAAECYTTRQSIRRFCRDIGLDNFQSFKRYLEHEYDQATGYYFADVSDADYPNRLRSALLDMTLDINESSAAFADAFCATMHEARECVFLVSDIYTSACAEFQKQMILSGRMVRIVSSAYLESELVSGLDARDMLVTISISGRWAREVAYAVAVPAQKVLLTTSRDQELIDLYDAVCFLSSIEQPASKTAYHQYGIQYLLDLLQRRYRDVYC